MATADAKVHVAEFTNEPFIDFSNPDNRKKMEAALGKVKSEFGQEYPMWIAGKKVVTEKKKKVDQPIAAVGSAWIVSGSHERTSRRGD